MGAFCFLLKAVICRFKTVIDTRSYEGMPGMIKTANEGGVRYIGQHSSTTC